MKNDQRTIFGWAMYDWANSAYATTTMAAILPALFSGSIVPEGGYAFAGRLWDGQTMWAFMVSFAAFLVFLMAPVLGAIADFTAAKKRFLRVFAYGGALFAGLLCFVGSGDVVLTMVLFLITQMGFVSANVFYDGFLPEISTPETIDQISARGYAFGYLGGGLQFALSLTLIQVHAELGIGEEAAVKLSLALVGVWWFAFSFVSFRRLRDSGDGHALPPAYQARPRLLAYVSLGFSRTWITARKLLGFKQLSLFLLAFMIYNDGVQTVIAMAAAYATDTLELELWVIMAAMLVIQIVAFVGALVFGALARRIGAQRAVLVSLGLWSLTIVCAFFLPAGASLRFLVLGAIIGLVLGGTQSLSRSLYGSMIPETSAAEFYGFYSVFAKFSAIWGPFIFALVSASTGSGRYALLSIIILLLGGAGLLARVDVPEARASRLRWGL
jgi:UMF1 family MFS transporter